MKWIGALLIVGMPSLILAQPGLFPLSRAMEAPHAAVMHRYKVDRHTAVRPYLRSDLATLPGSDSLLSEGVLPFLDRWAGRDSSRFRGGPLLDLNAGLSSGRTAHETYRLGAGFWAEAAPHRSLTLHVDGMAWSERFPEHLDSLVQATSVAPGEGYAYGSAPAYLHYDWNAHVNWTTSRFFNITVGRGKNFWGEGYRSLMLSDNAYSYPYLRIATTFWKVRYVNLYALMDDIRGADGVTSGFRKKATSMHYLSCNIHPRFNFGLFEAVVWQTNDPDRPRGFDFNYWNPVIFYRPLEFGLGSPDNAILGFALNVKAGHNSLFYGQLVLDEFLLREVRGGTGWFANKQGFQVGWVGYEVFQQRGLDVRAEFNYVRPFMYTHSDTRQNYAHFNQPLAHPYGSNFYEALAMVDWRKGRWSFREHVAVAVMGVDTGTFSWGSNIYRPENDRPTRDEEGRLENYNYYLADPVQATLFTNEVRAAYAISERGGLRLEAAYQFRSWVPELGRTLVQSWFRLGLVALLRDHNSDQQVRAVLP
ncbi:MAG: hypothetical protein IPO12_14645 [Flavobacteriales bacterium]|nr:hypothetical protein [Flavobacteriales bacterium]